MILDNCGIGYIAVEFVEEIMCRAGTDMCPFEKRVINIEDPVESYLTLSKAVKGGLNEASLTVL